MDEQNLFGTDYTEPEPLEIPDPAASPDSYQDFDIPEIDSDFDVPEIDTDFDIPQIEDDFNMPSPAMVEPPPAVTQPASAVTSPPPAIPDPVPASKPAPAQSIPQQAEENPEDYSGHYSWNGSGYVETGQPSPHIPPQSAPQQMQSQNQNTYTPPNYSQPAYNGQQLDPNLESRANSVKTLGIWSIVLSILGGCGCGTIGLILSIVGLSKASGMKTVIPMMSDTAKKNLSTGRKCCVAAIIITIVMFILGFLAGMILPALIGYMEESSSYYY